MSTEWRTRDASVIEGVCVPHPRKRTHSRFARNSPVGWKERGYELDYTVEQALRQRVSTVNIKSRDTERLEGTRQCVSEKDYDARVAILDPGTSKPAIRLAVEGCQMAGTPSARSR